MFLFVCAACAYETEFDVPVIVDNIRDTIIGSKDFRELVLYVELDRAIDTATGDRVHLKHCCKKNLIQKTCNAIANGLAGELPLGTPIYVATKDRRYGSRAIFVGRGLRYCYILL